MFEHIAHAWSVLLIGGAHPLDQIASIGADVFEEARPDISRVVSLFSVQLSDVLKVEWKATT